MNSPKFLPRVIRLTLALSFLAGCITPSATPTPSPALSHPPTAAPPIATPTLAPTPTPTILKPGDKIGQMSVEIPSGFAPNWLDYCSPAFSDQPGGETVACAMPLTPGFEIGAA